jgi:hypothetical protein
MSGQRHPDTETLASLRTGLVRGFRRRRLAAHVARCARCQAVSDELAAVSSFLSAVPVPALPVSFERRITGALAAEAAARAATAHESADAAAGNGQPVLTPAGADPGGVSGQDSAGRVPAPRRGPAAGRRRDRTDRFRPAMAFVPVVACLLLAGFGYLLSNTGATAGPPILGPAAASASVPRTASSPSSFGFEGPGSSAAPQIKKVPVHSGKIVRTPAATASPGVFITSSGTSYQAGTLRSQVSTELQSMGAYAAPPESASATGGASSPSAGASSTSTSNSDNGGGFFATTALAGCVLHLTNNETPTFVDEATYQSEPVYVIAVPDHVWVVGRGCTASNPELITTLDLTAP